MTKSYTETRRRAMALMLEDKLFRDQFIARSIAIHHPTLYVRYADKYTPGGKAADVDQIDLPLEVSA